MGSRSRKASDLSSQAALVDNDSDHVTITVNLNSSIWLERHDLVAEEGRFGIEKTLRGARLSIGCDA